MRLIPTFRDNRKIGFARSASLRSLELQNRLRVDLDREPDLALLRLEAISQIGLGRDRLQPCLPEPVGKPVHRRSSMPVPQALLDGSTGVVARHGPPTADW
jgi:hypothetical protein